MSAANDARVSEAVEEYLAALEAGEAPDRVAFLARHADVAGPLAQALDGLALFRAAAPALRQAAADTLGGLAAVGGLANVTLADYRLLREVGRGGMGVVYEAEQLSLGRRVALKVLPFAAGLDALALTRFQFEARLAAGLLHPNIVPVYDTGSERGVHFYAMQFIDGRSLADLLRERRADAGRSGTADTTARGVGTAPATSSPDREHVRTVVRLGLEAAAALDYAHRQGVVHRDVKPGNLLVDGSGRLWVTDFGLAFHADAAASAAPSAGEAGPVGTLRYMSPEQALGRRELIDARSDVYSLGVTLYELLTLEPPFPGEVREEVLRRVTTDEPTPPRRLVRWLPADLETVVLKAMSREPAERYPTARELADDLRRFLDDHPVQARRPTVVHRLRKWARRHRHAVALVTATLVIGVVAGLSASTALVYWAYQAKEEQRQRAEERERLAMQAAQVMATYSDEVLEKAPGRQEQARDFLRSALVVVRELAEAPGASPEARFQAARAYWRVGAIESRLGNFAAAEEAFAEAVQRMAPLMEAEPDNRTYRFERANYVRLYGGVVVRRDLAEGERLTRIALEDLERLTASERPKPELIERLNDVRWRLAEYGARAGRRHEAIAFLRQMLASNQELAAQYPTHALSHIRLVNNWFRLAHHLVEIGALDEAEAAYRRAVAEDEYLERHHPGPPDVREETWAMRHLLGRLLLRRGKMPEAERCLSAALAEAERRTERYPHVAANRLQLALVLDSQAHLYAGTHRTAQAEEACRRTLAVAAGLPPGPEYLCVSLRLRLLGPQPELRDPFRSLAEARRYASEPGRMDAGWFLAVAHCRAGEDVAAVEGLRAYLAGDPGSQRGHALFLLAISCRRLGWRVEAERYQAEAVRWMRKNYPRDPELWMVGDQVR